MRGWGALVGQRLRLRGLGLGLVLSVAVLAGCGHAPAHALRAEEDDPEPIARGLPTHDVYEVMARTRISFGEHELATLRTRLHLFVEERSRRGVSIRARVFRLGETGETSGFSDVEVELDRRGGIVHDPLSVCDDPDIDDLSPTRVVRHVLGSLAPWDGAAEGTVTLDVSEIEAPLAFRYRRGDGGILARGSGSARLGSFAVSGWRLRSDGEAHVRADERLDPDDALSMRVRLVAELVGDVTDVRGRSRSGVIEIRSDIVSRPSDAVTSAPETCEAGFSPADVVAQIDAHRAEITRCYETELANDPTLHGRLRVEMSVLPLGEVSGVHVTADDLATPAVGACVVEVIRRLRFVEGPVGETRYEFPFAFEPSAEGTRTP
jgi:hypothetical protein